MPRRQATRRRAPRNNLRIIVIVSLAILAYFVFSLSDLVISKHRLDEHIVALRDEVTRLKAESTGLEQEVAWLQTDQALEALARDELGWVKPGETGIVNTMPTPTPAPANPSEVQLKVSRVPNWERWRSLFFGE